MKVLEQIQELKNQIIDLKAKGSALKVGFVPTMGALHQGHISLIKEARRVSDIVVCSIFVNPTQFNDPKDLINYPRTEESDVILLQESGCDFVFLPSVETIYPPNQAHYEIDLEGIDNLMEGQFRENHFLGVAMVVERLFEIVEPDVAFFGQKDFQQIAVIRKMVEIRKLKVEIVSAPIIRDELGLALSSRNARLSDLQKNEALIICQTLSYGKSLVQQGSTPEDCINHMKTFFQKGSLRLEYIELVHAITLQKAVDFNEPVQCCIAAYCGEVRLIDNMQFT